MKKTFVILSQAGPERDLSKGSREQRLWEEHAAFIDGMVDEGFIMMGGPFVEDGSAMLIVHAESEDDVRATMKNDPWYVHGLLKLDSVKRWDIFIDQRR